MEEPPPKRKRTYKDYNDAACQSTASVPRQTVWSAKNPSAVLKEDGSSNQQEQVPVSSTASEPDTHNLHLDCSLHEERNDSECDSHSEGSKSSPATRARNLQHSHTGRSSSNQSDPDSSPENSSSEKRSTSSSERGDHHHQPDQASTHRSEGLCSDDHSDANQAFAGSPKGDGSDDDTFNNSTQSKGSSVCSSSTSSAELCAANVRGERPTSSANRCSDVDGDCSENEQFIDASQVNETNQCNDATGNSTPEFGDAHPSDSDPSSSSSDSESDDDRRPSDDNESDLNYFSEDDGSSGIGSDAEPPDNQPPSPPPPPAASGLDKLRDKLRGEYSRRVEDRAAASYGEILLNCQEFCRQHPMPLTAQEDLHKLINSIFYKDIVPGTKYKLDKLYTTSSKIKYYFFCSKCFLCFGELDHKTVKVKICNVCQTENIVNDLTKANFFIIIDSVEQLQLLLQDPEVASALKNPNQFSDNGVIMTDLHDGSEYKRFVASLDFREGQYYISFTACTDGTPVFRTSTFSLWPIFISINELPAHLRMKNILLTGLWFGRGHPKMDLFLEKFSDYVKTLSVEGFFLTVAESVRHYKGFLLGFCGDSGARGSVQCVHAHNGESSCNWCLHPGEVEGDGSNARKFLQFDLEPALRTADEVLRDGMAVLRLPGKDNHVNGVTGISPLMRCPKFDIVHGMILDTLHWANFGVSRRMGKLWLGETKKSAKKKKKDGENAAANNIQMPAYYVGTEETIAVINKRINHLRPPLEVRRILRDLSQIHDYNAREWENWCLYFSVPILKNILPERFLKHWTLFVQAFYLLMKSHLRKSEIEIAHTLMKMYVDSVFDLYGKKEMSFNMHISLHAAENAMRWGNAFSVSTYAFENGNKILKSKIHANKGIPHQIIRCLGRDLALNVLRAEASTAQTDEFRKSIGRKEVKKCTFAGSVQCMMPKKFEPSQEELWYCQQEGILAENFVQCSRIIVENICYSCDKGTTKTNNSFAFCMGGEIVKIRKIIANEQTGQVYLFVSKVRCTPYALPPLRINISLSDFSPFLYTVNVIEHRITVISCKVLKTICVYMQVNCQFYKGDFLSVMANTCNVF